MNNKETRSIILSLILGDGCLHNFKLNGITYSKICIDHGLKQADYHAWKAQLLSKLLDRPVNVRKGHQGRCVTLQVNWKRMRSWRKFIYYKNKKSLPRILPFITNPIFAFTVWLMDDGYCEPSISTLATGKKVNYGARFRIFTNSQTMEQQHILVDWFKEKLGITALIKTQKRTAKYNEQYFLKFSQADSLKMWAEIRGFVLQFKSMQYKFRYIEQVYQKKMSQRIPDESQMI